MTLMAVGLTSACAPDLLWYGHNPGRTTRFELRARGGRAWLQTGTTKSPAFDEIHVADLMFSPQGDRFAVPVRRGSQWAMLIDGKESALFDSVEPALFSVDGRHVAFAGICSEARSEAQGPAQSQPAAHAWQVVLDGVAGPRVESFAAGTLTFASSSLSSSRASNRASNRASSPRFGYVAEQGGCKRVFTNDTPPRGCYRRVKSLFIGTAPSSDAVLLGALGEPPKLEQPLGSTVAPLPGLFALAVAPSAQDWAALLREEAGVRVVRNGVTVAVVDDASEVSFSPRGQLAYAEKAGATWRFVLEGQREAPFAWIQGITFSGGGARHGYRAGVYSDVTRVADSTVAIVVDGREVARAPFADGLVFGPDERRMAFALREKAAASWLVCDGRRFSFDILWENSIGFSRDGRHFGAVVGDRDRRQLAITMDGTRALPFDSEELFGAAAQGAARLDGLRGWVVAELERRTQPEKGSP